MKVKIAKIVGPLIAVILLILAARVLYVKLGALSFAEVRSNFSALPLASVIEAILFTIGSYLVLTLYDLLALRYIKHSLPYLKVAMASFVGYTLSHNLGFPLISGGAARYRLFSSWGLCGTEIAQAIAFSGLVFWVGFLLLSGCVLTFDPPPLPPDSELLVSLRPLGLVCLILVFLYYWLFVFRGRTLRVKQFEFPAPPIGLSFKGMVVSSLDWVLAAHVAYALLPQAGLTYVEFLGIFQLGQVFGILSHVPGGLGVFEATVLMFLSGRADTAMLAAALLAYRIIYFLAPLVVSMTLLLVHEICVHRKAGDASKGLRPVSLSCSKRD